MQLKRLILILACGALATFAAAAAPRSGRAAARNRACVAQEPAAGALMVLDHTTYDFGTVPRKGGDLVHEFAFTNEGTVPLVVVRVVTSLFVPQGGAPEASGGPRAVGNDPHRLRAPQERGGSLQQGGADLLQLDRGPRTGHRAGQFGRRGEIALPAGFFASAAKPRSSAGGTHPAPMPPAESAEERHR